MTLLACVSNSDKVKEIPTLKIVNYLDTLQSKYPNNKTNSAIKDELNDFFKKDFKKKINQGILEDLPFILDKVEKCGKRYVVSLQHSLTSKVYKSRLLDDLEIDLYGFVDEKTAKSLIEKKPYLVKCKFIEYINFQNNQKYCATVLMSPFMGFPSDTYSSAIQLGALGVKIDLISLFNDKTNVSNSN